jgi:hypothetical protein
LGNLTNDKVSQPNADLQRHAKQLEKPNPVVVFFAIGPSSPAPLVIARADIEPPDALPAIPREGFDDSRSVSALEASCSRRHSRSRDGGQTREDCCARRCSESHAASNDGAKNDRGTSFHE